MYQIFHGEEVEEAQTRKRAITMAREISEQTFNTVVVEDEREVERLTYRNGSLTQYSYDTRKG